jgi:class 3 adenylate cyclase
MFMPTPLSLATVADISGFTAWGSMRDPHQVFTLLESIFQAFDAIAKKYRVFKVETIGDCYVGTLSSACFTALSPSLRSIRSVTSSVAVCGVPTANARHAVVMSRFARSIMVKFRTVCHGLELTLGPDTGGM